MNASCHDGFSHRPQWRQGYWKKFPTQEVHRLTGRLLVYWRRISFRLSSANNERVKWNPLTPNDPYRGRTAPLTPKVAFYIFIQQIQVLNILNMVYTLRFFPSKCSLFHNSNVFGFCIFHILYTGCAKIKKNNSGAKRLSRAIERKYIRGEWCGRPRQ